jgi:hypothetical protein
MKNFIILMCFCNSLMLKAQALPSADEAANEARIIERCKRALDESAAWSDSEKMDYLSIRIRQMGSLRSRDGYSEELDETYFKTQQVLLSIPNHAQYFLNKATLETDKIEQNIKSSRLHRVLSIATLRHLPSPETMKGLGDLLWDERGGTPGGGELSNAQLAAQQLYFMGIRNAPRVGDGGYFTLQLLEMYREWYKKIRSGEMSFSFEGQSLEYRFKPDGTWETTPLAISDEGLREELKPSVPPTSAATFPPAESMVPPSAISTRWLGIAGAAALLIVAGAWLSRKLKR